MSKPRRAVERQARQHFILDAARSVLARKGIEGATMDDIASASQYTRRTLYAYFKSRDEILLRVHQEDLARRWRMQQDALAVAEGSPARIRIWAETLVSFWREHPHAMRMELHWDIHRLDPRRLGESTFRSFQSLNEELAEGLREIFRTGVQEGSLRSDLEVDLCISQFVTTIRSIAYRALSAGYSFAQFDPDRYVTHYLDLFLRGIRNETRRTSR